MSDFLFWCLALSVIYYIVRCYNNVERFYQYPTLAAIATLIFILPTLFFIKDFNYILPVEDYNRYCVNALLCFWGGIAGYYWGFKKFDYSNFKKKHPFKYEIHYEKMIRVLAVYIMVGAVASALIPASTFADSIGGQGAITLYFARLLRPAAIIVFAMYLIKPKPILLAFFLIWLLFALEFMIISGRRSEFFTICMVFMFPLFLVKGKAVNRALIIPGVFLGLCVVVLFPIIRPYTKSGNWSQIANISLAPVIADFTSGERTNEVIDASLNMAAVARAGQYNYGLVTVVDGLISQYASSTLFGKDFKESLLFDKVNLAELRDEGSAPNDKIGFKFYLTPTGYANAFVEFGYFGWVMYFAFGVLCAKLYKRAKQTGNFRYIVFYCMFSIMILFAVYDSIPSIISTYFLPYLLVFYHVIGAVNKQRKRIYVRKKVLDAAPDGAPAI